MQKKYELISETCPVEGSSSVVLRRIRALQDFGTVKKGDVGGFVESEANLSQEGYCWISDNARVSGNAQVYGNARVSGNAQVYGKAQVSGNAQVYGKAQVSGNAQVYGDVWVGGDAQVHGDARIYGDAQVHWDARIYGDAQVHGDAQVYGNARVSGNAQVYGKAQVSGNAQVYGNAQVSGNDAICSFRGFGSAYRETTAYLGSKGSILVSCGCFFGSLEEFRRAVLKTHAEGSKHRQVYLSIASLIELRLQNIQKDT